MKYLIMLSLLLPIHISANEIEIDEKKTQIFLKREKNRELSYNLLFLKKVINQYSHLYGTKPYRDLIKLKKEILIEIEINKNN